MNKKILCLLVLVVIMLNSCGIYIEDGPLIMTGSYAVPGMVVYTLKGLGADCNILEKDQYGRVLFEYEHKNIITQKREKAIVIVQKYTNNEVYFYEDICYLIEAYQQFDIDTLKEQNDWDKPLDDSKMTYRWFFIDLGLDVEIQSSVDRPYDLREIVADKLGVSEELLDFGILDATVNGNDLYLFEKEDNGETQMYYVISDKDYNVKIHPISSIDNFIEELVAFKAEAGWK